MYVLFRPHRPIGGEAIDDLDGLHLLCQLPVHHPHPRLVVLAALVEVRLVTIPFGKEAHDFSRGRNCQI